jgi:fibro-slime domain-containing protein
MSAVAFSFVQRHSLTVLIVISRSLRAMIRQQTHLAVTWWALVLSVVGTSCAGIKPMASAGSGGSNGRGTGGHSASDGGTPPPVDAITINPMLCGNGVLDPGEQCDDGNTVGGDGCTPLCQIEQGWTCPTPGQPCVRTEICGDGILQPPEQCDDGNVASGDGCSSTCMIEPGWVCRVPGKPCTPTCGDGMITGTKTCDDGNDVSGDGCSSTCQVEPGWTCTGMPSVCTKAVCGNGIIETGEACDCGTSVTKFPSGCTGPNGLFNGDGTGCSTTCTKEPICRGTNGTGATHACATSCGNGNLEAGEQCDDGNLIDGDGCSSTCQIEAGFTCTTETNADTQTCTQTGDTGQCLELAAKYRDFKNESATGGHPDFFFLGSTWTTGDPRYVTIAGVQGQTGTVAYTKRSCVPNSGGPAKQNDSTARAWDLASANLDDNGYPAFNTARAGCNGVATFADCQFTDYSNNGNGGHVPGYSTTATYAPTEGLTYVSGADGNPMYHGCAPVVTSAATFEQWWRDGAYESDGATADQHALGTIELGPVTVDGATLYRFSSAQNSVYGGFFPFDPPANAFSLYYTATELNAMSATTGLVYNGSAGVANGTAAGPGTATTMPSGEQLLCDLWPYWYSPYENSAVATFGGGNGCKGDQYLFPPSVAFATEPNGNWITGMQGWYHDSWFSVEARYLIAYSGPFDLQFYGDDDTFVFINGILVIDLGGVHQRLPGKVHVDGSGNATTQEGGSVYLTGETLPAGAAVGDLVPCDGSANAVDPISKVAYNSTCAAGVTTCDCRDRTVSLGMTPGNTYEIAIFERDGHPSESNFQLTLPSFSTTESVCAPHCGDGIVAGSKECDCGDGTVPVPAGCPGPNSDTTYGGCTTTCTWGPYCGDGIVQMPEEQCDLGSANNTADYGASGCTPGCQTPPYCGDGIVDTSEGEQCDLGANNGVAGSGCSSTCMIEIGVN